MPFDPERYAAGLRKSNEIERQRLQEKAKEAREEAEALARRIGEQDGEVARVYLFGSLLQDAPGSESFDIDLALDGGDVYKAMDVAETASFSVDVVDLRRLPAHVRCRILRTGRVLYERKGG